MARSNSSSDVGLFEKLRYSATLLFMRARMPGGEAAARAGLDELREYVATFERETGKRAIDSTVVEIGFGARPRRAFMLTGFFRQVYAIDLDAPLLTTMDVMRTARKNGMERAVKSLVRHTLFERREWPRFHEAMRRALPSYDRDKVRFIVGSAGSEAVWSRIGQVDLALSFDVFEHIPPADLRGAMAMLRRHLAPGGIVLTRPLVFTGISGGHNLEWYPHRVEGQTPATAWIHLTDPDFKVNTYVNRLRRTDYRRLFDEAGFDIVHDEARRGRFGEEHLTPENRAKLTEYDDYELFSNEVDFRLRPKTAAMS